MLPSLLVAALTKEGGAVSIVIFRAEEARDGLPALSVALAVRVCDPSVSRLELIAHDPLPSAVAEPRVVVPSVSKRVIVDPASAVPEMVGVSTEVMLSVDEDPESDVVARSRASGAAGELLSRT